MHEKFWQWRACLQGLFQHFKLEGWEFMSLSITYRICRLKFEAVAVIIILLLSGFHIFPGIL